MRDQAANVCLRQQIVRYATKQPFAETAVAICAGHHDARVFTLRQSKQFRPDACACLGGNFPCDINLMPSEELTNLIQLVFHSGASQAPVIEACNNDSLRL